MNVNNAVTHQPKTNENLVSPYKTINRFISSTIQNSPPPPSSQNSLSTSAILTLDLRTKRKLTLRDLVAISSFRVPFPLLVFEIVLLLTSDCLEHKPPYHLPLGT